MELNPFMLTITSYFGFLLAALTITPALFISLNKKPINKQKIHGYLNPSTREKAEYLLEEQEIALNSLNLNEI
jgi:hypothetical protein